MNSRLYNGDCFDVMNNIQDKSVDMILCDLPYNCTAQEWDKEINLDLLWSQYERIRKDDCPVVLFSSQPFTTKLINSNIKLSNIAGIGQKTKLQISFMPNVCR